jgi:exodeoxyribonuclease VII large subunit
MSLTLDGIGILYQKYEALKKELELKGYFDPVIKKDIPKFPKRIGVVTSPTGAVIQDIKNTINRRYRLTEIILYPALVQGPSSATSIADQIRKANKDALVDVLIVGRGGGSIEDLWGFNERDVADAIYESHIPIISAVGHETDFTIADFVSDLRAPTPTAAAELATPSEAQLTQYLIEQGHRLKHLLKQNIQHKTLHLNFLEERLTVSSPFQKIEHVKDTLMKLDEKLKRSMMYVIDSKWSLLKQSELKLTHPGQIIKQKEVQVHHLKEKLDSFIYYRIQGKIHQFQLLKDTLEALSPLKVMDKGFGLIQKDQKVISSIQTLKKKDTLFITLKDGIIETEIQDIKEKTYGKHNI